MAGDRISLRMVPGFALVGENGQERRASEAQSPVARGEGAVGVKHPPLLRAAPSIRPAAGLAPVFPRSSRSSFSL